MIRWKNRYGIKVINQEGFSRIIPCTFRFKRSAFKYTEEMRAVHPLYGYEVIDNFKGIKIER